MKLPELLKYHLPQPDFKKYFTNFKPALDPDHLELDPVVGYDRRTVKAILEGDCGILLGYKGREAACTSMSEEENGEIWRAFQVSGCKGQKSYRVASGLRWPSLLGDTVHNLSRHPESKVHHIVMPTFAQITNIEGAKSFSASAHYRQFRNALGMLFSESEGMYICDVKR